MPPTFAYCRCFLTQHIFVHQINRYLVFTNEAQFKNDYSTSLASNFEEILELAKKEVQRRKLLRSELLNRIRHVRQVYKPLHLELYEFNDDFLDDRRFDVKYIGSEVYEAPVFKKTFVKKLMKELQNFKSSNIPHEQPNSMNHHGVILDEIGFQSFFDNLRTRYIQPLAQKVFNDPDLILDTHRAFVVKYALNEDKDLAAHFDNAEITLNVALTEDFQGGELVFHDKDNGYQWPAFGYEQWPMANGIIHKGSHIHEALPITSGERCNLIIWCRSSKMRQKQCPMCRSPPDLEIAPMNTYGDGFLWPTATSGT